MSRLWQGMGGAISPLLLTAALSAAAQFNPQATLPGWSPWQPAEQPFPFGYETGFSNGDALQSSAWGLYCTERATEAHTTATYWHRVSNLVGLIGTGQAESGCLINGEMISSGAFVAVKSGLGENVCLRVAADIGNGLVLRQRPSTTSARLRVLPNGTSVRVESLPHALQADETGRQWLYLSRPQPGWVSAAAQPGAPVNLHLCP